MAPNVQISVRTTHLCLRLSTVQQMPQLWVHKRSTDYMGEDLESGLDSADCTATWLWASHFTCENPIYIQPG